ncbi:hypothetical protein GCM10010272_43110 [Streptomyces lateritius]|nr:hypothetical protein GCM10010272_43110 [Streptomyces lateritius]
MIGPCRAATGSPPPALRRSADRRLPRQRRRRQRSVEARRDLAAATAAPAVGAVEDRTVAGPEGAPPDPRPRLPPTG